MIKSVAKPETTRIEAIYRRFAEIAARHLRVEAAQISEDAYLQDLGASSLDLVEITLEAEQEFGVLLAGKPLFDAAILIFGPGVLEEEGDLTGEGKRLLAQRFPHLEAENLEGPFDLVDVQREISKVSVWVEAIADLTAMIPQRCVAGGGEATADPDGLPVCREAPDSYEPPSLEEFNALWLQRYYQDVYLPAHKA